jgi:hypothetical protein
MQQGAARDGFSLRTPGGFDRAYRQACDDHLEECLQSTQTQSATRPAMVSPESIAARLPLRAPAANLGRGTSS